MYGEIVYNKTRIELMKSRLRTLLEIPKWTNTQAKEVKGLVESLEVEKEKKNTPISEGEKNYLKFRGKVVTGELPYLHNEVPDTIQELYEKVACHLTGRDVTVRIKKPYLKNIHGVFMPVKGGGGIIDISPELSRNEQYWYFLHETAHARLHYEPVKHHNPAVDYKPSTVELTPSERSGPVVDKKEYEANTKAENWNEWAKARHGEFWRFGEDCSPQIPKLFALLEMEVYTE